MLEKKLWGEKDRLTKLIGVKMKVVPVEPIAIELFWDKIEPLVKKSVTYSGGRHTVDTTKFLFRKRYDGFIHCI